MLSSRISLHRAFSLPFVAILFAFVGCSNDEEDITCSPIWVLERGQLTARHMVDNGELMLEVKNANQGVAVSISQDGLSGDFLITASFDAFAPGTGSGGFAQMKVFDPVLPDQGICGASIGSGMIDAFVAYPGTSPDSRFTNDSSGEFIIQRSGNRVTAKCTVGEKTASRTSTFTDSDLTLSLEIGSNDEQLSGTTTINITEFMVSDSAGISSDDFECDRVSL